MKDEYGLYPCPECGGQGRAPGGIRLHDPDYIPCEACCGTGFDIGDFLNNESNRLIIENDRLKEEMDSLRGDVGMLQGLFSTGFSQYTNDRRTNDDDYVPLEGEIVLRYRRIRTRPFIGDGKKRLGDLRPLHLHVFVQRLANEGPVEFRYRDDGKIAMVLLRLRF